MTGNNATEEPDASLTHIFLAVQLIRLSSFTLTMQVADSSETFIYICSKVHDDTTKKFVTSSLSAFRTSDFFTGLHSLVVQCLCLNGVLSVDKFLL